MAQTHFQNRNYKPPTNGNKLLVNPNNRKHPAIVKHDFKDLSIDREIPYDFYFPYNRLAIGAMPLNWVCRESEIPDYESTKIIFKN
jgi:hypothetical protein